MKPWQAAVLIVLIVSAMMFIAYNPLGGPGEGSDLHLKAVEGLMLEDGTEHVLTFCSDPWVPYAGYADAEQKGYIIEVLQAIYGPFGYEVKFVNLPWSRCLRDTRDGLMNGLAGADFHEVPDFVFPKHTVGVTWPTFFASPDTDWTYEGPESLKNAVIGVIQDYTYSREFDEYIKRAHDTKHIYVAQGEDALERLIKALQNGDITAFVENAPVVHQTMKESGMAPDTLREAGAPGPGVLLYVPFSPRLTASFELADIYDRGIVQLRESGRLNEILLGYGIEDWFAQAQKLKHLISTGAEDPQ